MTAIVSRRGLLGTGGIGFLAAAGMTGKASAKAEKKMPGRTMTDAEKANIQLVKELLDQWATPNADIDKIMAKYIAPNAPVRWYDDQPVVMGPVAAAIMAKAILPPDSIVTVEWYDAFAYGPLVASSRLDTIIRPGQPNEANLCAGVHVVKNGMIVEYTDFVLR